MTVSALEQIPKLLTEVERLRRDIAALYERIAPFGKMPDWETGFSHRGGTRRTPSDEPTAAVNDIRTAIRGCESDIGFAVSLLRDISEHAPSREAMKPYIKNHIRKPRRTP